MPREGPRPRTPPQIPASTCPLLAPPGLSHPFSIDIFEDYIYGVTYINNRIFKIHKFGHKPVTNLTSGLNHATDVVLYHQYKQPEGVWGPRDPHSAPGVGGRCQGLVSDMRGALAELLGRGDSLPEVGVSGWAEQGVGGVALGTPAPVLSDPRAWEGQHRAVEGNVLEVLRSRKGRVVTVLSPPVPSPPSVTNPCDRKKCEWLCLLSPSGPVCTCPNGKRLDNGTCVVIPSPTVSPVGKVTPEEDRMRMRRELTDSRSPPSPSTPAWQCPPPTRVTWCA